MLWTVCRYGALCRMHIFDQVKTNLLYVCEDLEHDPDLERVQKFELMARNF
jgi:hypothetical protein